MGKLEDVEAVLSYIDEFKLVSRLRNLLMIPSYTGTESSKASYVRAEMVGMGLEVIENYIDYRTRRRNVLGILRGSGGGKSLMLCAHLDTRWPVEGEDKGHSAIVDDGRIFGIGAADSMGPLAAILCVADAIKRCGVSLAGDLYFLASADEMCFKDGAKTILENGLKADYCVMGEATDLDIGIVHTGKAEVEIRTTGMTSPKYEIAALAERMGEKPVNAVLSMNTIINCLLRMQREDPFFQVTHPLLPGKGASLNIGPIIGGAAGDGDPNRKPGREVGEYGLAKRTPTYCRLRVGARTWPGQSATGFYETVCRWIEVARREDSTVNAAIDLYLDNGNDPFEISPKAEIVELMRKAIKAVLRREANLVGNVFSTEGPFYQRAGMQFVYCAPGLHRSGTGEFVSKQELMDTARVYAAMAVIACE